MDETNKELLDEIKGWLGNYEAKCLLNVLRFQYQEQTYSNIIDRLTELGVDEWVYRDITS